MGFQDKTARRLAILAIVSGSGCVGCLYGLVQTHSSPWRTIFAFATAFFTLTLVLGVGIPLMLRVASQESRKVRVETPLRVEKGVYIVGQSISDQVTFVLLAIAIALITAFAYARGFPVWIRCVLSAMLLTLVPAAIGYCFRKVHFSGDSIRVRTFPFREFTEPYHGITVFEPRHGNLLVRFADGKTLNLRPGLKDLEKVKSMLAERSKTHSAGTFEQISNKNRDH